MHPPLDLRTILLSSVPKKPRFWGVTAHSQSWLCFEQLSVGSTAPSLTTEEERLGAASAHGRYSAQSGQALALGDRAFLHLFLV